MEVLEKAKIVSPYSDNRGSYSHTGVDVLSGTGNRSVRAVAKAKVIEVQNRMKDNYIVNQNSPVSEWAGNYIVLEHADGYISRYNHLKFNSIKVSIGDIIEEGTIIAEEGESGYATGIHLDFEVKKDGKFIDPTNYALGQANLPGYSEAKYLNLNSNIDTWRVYPMDVAPVVGNECKQLLPSKFGGLSYTIKDYVNENVAIIETRDFGQVQIYIGPETIEKYSITDKPLFGLVK